MLIVFVEHYAFWAETVLRKNLVIFFYFAYVSLFLLFYI